MNSTPTGQAKLLKAAKQQAPLRQSKTFQGKIEAIINYLRIGNVYCITQQAIKAPVVSPKKKIKVQDIYVQTGDPGYINRYLNTAWKYLDESLEKLISSDKGFYNTRKILIDCKTRCFLEMDKYDLSDIYAFEAIHAFSVVSKHGTFPVMYDNLVWKEEHLNILRDHCKVRSSFLRRLHVYIDKNLNSLINLPEIQSSPYEWDSKRKEIEITELLHAIIRSGRIKIKSGTTAQFREQFFRFFGLHDQDFNKRIHEISRRKHIPVFLDELIFHLKG